MSRYLRFLLLFGLLAAGFGCGEGGPAEVGASVEKIVNGHAASLDEQHSTVAILRNRSVHRWYDIFCSGTLISPTLVLTAAHCVTTADSTQTPQPILVKTPESMVIAAGYFGRSDFASAEFITVSQVIVHADFDWFTTLNQGDWLPYGMGAPHDIALLVLGQEVVSLPPISILRDADVDSALPPNSTALVSGYGQTETGSYGDLLAAPTTIDLTTPSEMLTSVPVEQGDTCFGDSGGPLYATLDGVTYLAGITSRGRADSPNECGDGGIYTRAPSYREWITEQAGDAFIDPLADASGSNFPSPPPVIRCSTATPGFASTSSGGLTLLGLAAGIAIVCRRRR